MFNAGTPVLRVFLVSFLLAAGFILSVRAAPTSNDAECCGPEVTGAPPRSPYAGPKNRLCTAKEFHDKMNELNDNQNCSFEMDHASTQDVEWVPHKVYSQCCIDDGCTNNFVGLEMCYFTFETTAP